MQLDSQQLHLRNANGYTACYGPALDDVVAHYIAEHAELAQAIKASPTRHAAHVSLLMRHETEALLASGSALPMFETPLVLHILGLGSSTSSNSVSQKHFHFVIISPSVDRARKKAKLPLRELHLTLTGSGSDSKQGIDTLIQPLDVESLPLATLDALVTHYLLRSDTRSLSAAISMLSRTLSEPEGPLDAAPSPQLARPAMLLGNAALLVRRERLAQSAFALAYACTAADNDGEAAQRTRSNAVKAILATWPHAELGPFTLPDEANGHDGPSLDAKLKSYLVRSWSAELRDEVAVGAALVAETAPTPETGRRVCEKGKKLGVRLEVGEEHCLMRFFSWLMPFQLAASSTPRNANDISALAQLGITHVLTLTAEEPLPSSWFTTTPSVRNTFLPARNMSSPTPAQLRIALQLAVRVASEGGALLVHCGGGKGRAGTVLAAYLCAFGLRHLKRDGPADVAARWEYAAMGSNEAMATVRALRPGSIESLQQEQGLKAWRADISLQGPLLVVVQEPQPSVPHYDLDAQLRNRLDEVDLFILVGLPGSGKSWFRNALVSRRPARFKHVSGDEDGGSQAVLTACGNFNPTKPGRGGSCLIVDRCNATLAARRELLAHALHARKPCIVYFDVPADVCAARAAARPSHPSVRPSAAKDVVRCFERQLVEPRRNEGVLGVITIGSFEAAKQLVDTLAPIELFKFPRTAHLLDLGAATEDDVVVPYEQQQQQGDGQWSLTEKIDGANLGISLDEDGQLLVQNRSHWTSSQDHRQFHRLDAWLGANRAELFDVLAQRSREETSFGLRRFVLFGEWMAARHSIHYTRLPSLFIAFDLYDRLTQKFLARPILASLLRRIPLVPELARLSTLPSPTALAEMAQNTPSAFYDGPVEGVYVKQEDGAYVCARGKVVRKGFIAGNEHWTKGVFTWNVVSGSTEHT